MSLSGFPPGGRFARRVSPKLSRPPRPAGRSPQERVCVCVCVRGRGQLRGAAPQHFMPYAAEASTLGGFCGFTM